MINKTPYRHSAMPIGGFSGTPLKHTFGTYDHKHCSAVCPYLKLRKIGFVL